MLPCTPAPVMGRVTKNKQMATVYEINKGINKSIEFKGIKAQYIIYLAVGLVLMLLMFAIMYVMGVNIYVCLAIIIPACTSLVVGVQYLSKKYGEFGLVKKMAQSRLPAFIITNSRNVFKELIKNENEKNEKPGNRVSNLQNRK